MLIKEVFWCPGVYVTSAVLLNEKGMFWVMNCGRKRNHLVLVVFMKVLAPEDGKVYETPKKFCMVRPEIQNELRIYV